jgi:hypothetical protein
MTPRSTPACRITLVLTLIGLSLATVRPAMAASGIEPEADRILRDMSAYLSGLGSFAVETETMVDFVLDSGQKIQLSHHRSVKVSRPNRMAAVVDGDDVHRKLWYNGETLTFLDVDHNVYAVTGAPPTITGMIEFVEKKLEIHVPLGDLLAEDPYPDLTRDVETGVYLGLHRVGTRKCHHLAFTQKNVDWQIWIDAGSSPAPRKVVITYKNQPSQPQYIAIMRTWDDAVEFSDDDFEFTPPEGATEVEFMIPEETSQPATGGEE